VTADYSAEGKAFADENMVRLIIRNLLSNAIKFTPKGGNIHVSTNLAENNLTFRVALFAFLGYFWLDFNQLIQFFPLIDQKKHHNNGRN
jgi:light-regulated signal transduction histidine kinase (bacteriophytochrome)